VNGWVGWISAGPLTDGACIEADIAAEPAHDQQQPLDERLGFSVMRPKGISHSVQALMLLDTTVMVNTEVVQIPGTPTFGQAYATHPSSVSLPLEVRTSAIRQYLFALFMLVGGGMGTFVVAAAIWLLASHPSEKVTWIVALGGFPFGLFLAVIGPAAAWTSVRDAVRTGPVLIIRADGIEDRYVEVVVPWAEVVQARIAYSRGSLNHVRLKLRTPISVRQNPFRFGTPMGLWHRPLDVLRIPVVLLDVGPYTLAQVVATLVKAHGGEITAEGGPMLPT
jgi:hypothetical protein